MSPSRSGIVGILPRDFSGVRLPVSTFCVIRPLFFLLYLGAAREFENRQFAIGADLHLTRLALPIRVTWPWCRLLGNWQARRAHELCRSLFYLCSCNRERFDGSWVLRLGALLPKLAVTGGDGSQADSSRNILRKLG